MAETAYWRGHRWCAGIGAFRKLMMGRGVTLLVAALLLQVAAVHSASLDKEACARLKAEETTLEQAGARGDMSKGPQWAKLNLAPERLAQIKRLLDVEEQLRFRCDAKSLVNLPHDVDPDPASTRDDDKEQPAKAAKSPKKKTPPKKAATPSDTKAQAGSRDTPAAKAPSPSSPKAVPGKTEKPPGKKAAAQKTKAKAKPDDAYRPTAPPPGGDFSAPQTVPNQ
jgi:hypothetical protein